MSRQEVASAELNMKEVMSDDGLLHRSIEELRHLLGGEGKLGGLSTFEEEEKTV